MDPTRPTLQRWPDAEAPTAVPPVPAPADPRAMLSGFGPGVQIMTTEGEIPVEWLATGDRIVTRDAGAQPVLWLGRRRLSRAALAEAPENTPVEIEIGALGHGCPTHPTTLAPQTRVLLAGYEVDLHTGVDEALAGIADLQDDARIAAAAAPQGTHYTYLLLPMHAVVQANGLWVESLLLDRATTRALAGHAPRGLIADPRLTSGHHNAARLCLAPWEVTAIRGPKSADALPDLIRRVA